MAPAQKMKNGIFNPHIIKSIKKISILLTLVMGISMSIAIFYIMRHVQYRSMKLEFDSEIRHLMLELKEHLNSGILMIESIQGLFDASYHVERNEFRKFTAHYINSCTSIQALAWASNGQAKERSANEDKITSAEFAGSGVAEGPTSGKIAAAGKREMNFPIRYVEPFEENRTIVGFDLLSEDHMREAIKKAIKTGRIKATSQISLPGSSDNQRFFMLVKPIYAEKDAADALSDHRKHIAGLVIGIFDTCGIINETVLTDERPIINTLFHDESVSFKGCFAGQNTLLLNRKPWFSAGESLNFAGQTWHMKFIPSKVFYKKNNYLYSWSIFFLCLASTFSLTIYLILSNLKNLKLEEINKELRIEEERRVKIEMALIQNAHALKVRVDELNCLYNISRVIEKYGDALENVFQKVVDVIRAAWGDTSQASVKIIYDEKDFKTDNYQPSITKNSVDILVNGIHKGCIEVARRENKSGQNHATEWLEKKKLMEIIARRLGSFIEAYLSKAEKDQLENQLMQSEKLASIGHLAAGVAHEINNPIGFVSSNLNTFSGYIEDIHKLITEYQRLNIILAESAVTGSYEKDILDQHHAVTRMEADIDIGFILDDITNLISESKDGTERIRQIVQDLKDYAHPGNKIASYANVNTCIQSTLNIVWNEIKYKADVIRDFGNTPDIKCYPQELNQVFMNLLVNAAQAIDMKGEIKISTSSKEDYVEVAISDTGQGIPENLQSKIFDPFFTTKDIGKGTGLGLNVVYSIIQKHKGSIDVKSEVGKGTTFTIRLKIDPGLPEPSVAA